MLEHQNGAVTTSLSPRRVEYGRAMLIGPGPGCFLAPSAAVAAAAAAAACSVGLHFT